MGLKGLEKNAGKLCKNKKWSKVRARVKGLKKGMKGEEEYGL